MTEDVFCLLPGFDWSGFFVVVVVFYASRSSSGSLGAVQYKQTIRPFGPVNNLEFNFLHVFCFYLGLCCCC